MDLTIAAFGPFCFGLVIGWVTYRTLRRRTDTVALGDIAAVISAIGGATVVGLFKNDAFSYYCLGTAVGFFAYFFTGVYVEGKAAKDSNAAAKVGTWMGTN